MRVVPYTDSTRIIQCFSQSNGLISLFHRGAKKQAAGHIRLGGFIDFNARSKSGASMFSLHDARWNPAVPTDMLAGKALVVWYFTIELLQRSLKENMALPLLLQRITTYYAMLTQQRVPPEPIIPLIIISHEMGLCDLKMVAALDSKPLRHSIRELGIKLGADAADNLLRTDALFNLELDRFQQHFSIISIEAMFLLED